MTLNVASTLSNLEPVRKPETLGKTAYAFLFPLGAFAFLGVVRRGKRLRSFSLLVALCLSVVGVAGISGCGGSTPATTTTTKPAAPSGTQVVTVTAKSAAATQTIQVTVNIGS
jgi:hypothetical protein